MNQILRTAVAAATSLLVLSACRAAPAETSTPEARPEPPAEDVDPPELAFALAADLDAEACTYEGPDSVPAGLQNFVFENGHPERTMEVILTRIGEGFDYADVLVWLGDERPNEVEQRVITPDWLDGDWRPIQPVGPATTTDAEVTVLAGRYALFCLLQGPPGHGLVWPATPLTVTG